MSLLSAIGNSMFCDPCDASRVQAVRQSLELCKWNTRGLIGFQILLFLGQHLCVTSVRQNAVTNQFSSCLLVTKASWEEQTSEVKLCCQMLQLSATATLQHHLQSHVLSALCCTEQCTCPATAVCLCCTLEWSQLPTGCSASHGGHWEWSLLEHCQRLQVALPHKSTLLWWLTVGPAQSVMHSPLAVAMSIVEQHGNGVLFVLLDSHSFLVEHPDLTFGVAVLCAAVVACGCRCTQPAEQVAQLAPQHSSSHQSCMILIVQTISTHVVNLVKGESNNVSNFDLAFSQCVIGITANASHCIIHVSKNNARLHTLNCVHSRVMLKLIANCQ